MIHEEKLLSGPAAVEAVSDYRPSYPTYHRWCQVGLLDPMGRRVKLESIKCGRVRKTSLEAVRRFFTALTKPAGESGLGRSEPNLGLEKRIREAEAKLDS